jgi:hypothetical protein
MIQTIDALSLISLFFSLFASHSSVKEGSLFLPACWCVLFLHFSFLYLKLVNGNKIIVHLNYLIAIYATSGLLTHAGVCDSM